ncbi:MAG TPA: hypothetical protein DHV62_07155 [Elusimicrobia bacterium]|jgi:predicted transcriptional regulator|nr:hypothetical protein [Elusimicrobiota bacterium]
MKKLKLNLNEKTRGLLIRIGEDLYEKVGMNALKRRTSKAAIIREALTEYFKRKKK